MCAECNEYVAVPESNDDQFRVLSDVPSTFDCTMCKHYLPCQKASGKTDDIICDKFFNMFPEDVPEDVVETSVEDVVQETICSGACEKCEGCPNALPHVANGLMDCENICDTVGYLVSGVKALNHVDMSLLVDM